MLEQELSQDSRSILTQELEKFNNSIFEIPNFDSITYKKNICDVFKKVEELDNFTEDLQRKVDNLLAAQQQEFVNAYTFHMKKIRQQFKTFEAEVLKQQQLVKYYENEGKMSNLVKKVGMLEEESKNLYSILAKKEKQIKSIYLEVKVQKQQNKRLTNQIREMLRNKNKLENMELNLQKNKVHKTQFFPTEVEQTHQCNKSIKKDLSRTTDEKGKIGFSYQISENSIMGRQTSEPHYESSLLKKINQLQTKNKKLAALNTKVLESRNQLQNLFLDAVAEIKRQVKLRKKMNYCSYEDFKKEDKLSLLVTIISNEELLKVVYERLFSKTNTNSIFLNPEQKFLKKTETNSEYLHTYSKYKHKKETSSIQTSSNKNQTSKDISSSFRNPNRNTKRGHTEDVSILPYI